MNDVFKKLNFKDQRSICVLNAPDSFQPALQEMAVWTVLQQEIPAGNIHFALAFVTTQTEVDELSKKLSARLEGDGLLWFAYPKGTSKRFRCEFNRDTGWKTLGDLGFEPVRIVAIDEDWSALRFRRTEFIKTFIRSEKMAMSAAGKERVKK